MVRWLTLLMWMSAGYRWAMMRAGIAAVCGVALTVALLSVGEAARGAIADALLGGGDQLRVQARSRNLGPVDLAGTVLPQRRMTESDLAAFAAVDGVAAVWPEAWSRFPVTLYGDVLGASMRSDAAMLGVVAAGVSQDVRVPWRWSPGEPIPVLAPRSILAVFNGSFAPANGLPKLTDDAVIGRTFTVRAGYSSIGRSLDQEVSVEAEVVGVTSYGGSLAAIVPIEAIAWIDGQLGLDHPGSISRAVLVLTPGADAVAVEEAVQALGWTVSDVGGAARRIAASLETLDAVGGVLGLILILATLLVMAQIYGVLLRQRSRDIAVLRGLGTRPAWLAWGMVAEVGVAASAAVGVGMGLGSYLGQVAADQLSVTVGELLGTTTELVPSLPWMWTVVFVVGVPITAVLAAGPAIIGTLSDGRLEG
jgi:putative ABC transport system permease protein